MHCFQSSTMDSVDTNQPDTSEVVYISALALIKMLKHCRTGVPLEVMGLILGEIVDDYTVNVVDAFAMPHTGLPGEAIKSSFRPAVSSAVWDPDFEKKMLDLLEQTERPEVAIGWYHSHPGFGCSPSKTDTDLQNDFEENISERAFAAIVDPLQSVKGKVMIEAFRTVRLELEDSLVPGVGDLEIRQTTSNLGQMKRINRNALPCGLNILLYKIRVEFKMHELEQKMLLSLNRHTWIDSLSLIRLSEHGKKNQAHMQNILRLAKLYKKDLEEQEEMTEEQLALKNVGKLDPKRHLEEVVHKMLADNILQSLGSALNTASFQ
ncbi:unnamed protein product [Gongylonema pulchrum]|uniref:MPN domain-containing protein n=1 Tax=Gongylonema pulchrum TaxID=637853 RepID=A0A183DSZ3_9BILA|nr:unnamed protein product [Gongylonema pulchrum]